MLERLSSLILGERTGVPEGVPGNAVPPRVVLRRGRLVPRIAGLLSGMGGPAAAVTLGRTIVLYPETRLTAALLTHELAHVRQWREDRLFPLRYAAANLRHGYRNNPYEVEARALAISEWPVHPADERNA